MATSPDQTDKEASSSGPGTAEPPSDTSLPENVQNLTESLEKMPALMQKFGTVLRSLYAENALPENATTREFLRLAP